MNMQLLCRRVERGVERRVRHFLQKHYYDVRPSIRVVKRRSGGKNIVGCEVGTFEGENAYNMLRNIPNLKKLYLVDPYELYVGYTDFKKTAEAHPTLLVDAQKKAKKQLKQYNARIEWIQAKFEADLILEPLDFIYIDGQHTYEAVIHDILEAEKLVKIGGVIAGHDYYPENHYLSEKYEVGCAVRDHYSSFSWKFNDWWVIHE